VDVDLLRPYAGKYMSDAGSGVLITIHEGRLLAFRGDGPGVFLMPIDENAFTPMISEPARVVFEPGTGLMTGLVFEQAGKTMRFARVG